MEEEKGGEREKVLSSKLTSQLNPTMQCGGSEAARAVGFIDRQTLGVEGSCRGGRRQVVLRSQ